ncbi:PucR family transcriptional regulator [Thermomicrobium sp. CFH 73360]|uniref:helix-turn-helix domain-containing protein n=1 Tax=Thermomicrobium sp. CFH 73360 TaxID=2951987 RepID=UPI002076A27D|nr:helix-turn-helix domain-containing protein [Thermomicrobium sp. CFH 73360]MCM8745480.1 PucR family transcriptional regulator [Thermomicrobium sp. CFH 73360]
MAELLLRDLCRWDRRFTLVCPPGQTEELVLERPISWAVNVRAAPPFLPPLRGDELIILSGRALREIEATGMANAVELLETLAEAPIAALVTEPNLFEEPIGSLPFLLFPGPIPLDLESTLNRLLTEQRRALYRLSTELTREFSRAALTGGIEAVVQAAALASGRSLVLQDSEGLVLAAAGPAPVPAPPTALAHARPHPTVRTLPEGRGERLLTTLSASGRLAYLSLLASESSTERDRLVLSLLAGLCASLLAQEGRSTRPAPLSQLVADLLLGRLSDNVLPHIAQRLGLNPNGPIVVALLGGEKPETRDQLVRRLTDPGTRDRGTTLGEAIALLLTPEEAAQIEARAAALTPTQRQSFLSGPSLVERRHALQPWYLVFARPLPRLRTAPEGLRQARFLAGLVRSGVVPGPVARFDDLSVTGPFALLYHLWGHPEAEAFRQRVLGPLLEEDERANELLQTLAAFLEYGSASEVAARLGIHRNTVAYRLTQVAERTARNLSDARDRLLLYLALTLGALPPAEPEAPQ